VAKDPAAYPPEYQVKAILDRTIGEDEILYLIKWVGWNEPTWEKKWKTKQSNILLNYKHFKGII